MLGIRAQTLYAYVSRGQIGMQPDPADPRRSLYRAEDIEGLKTRRSRGRRVSIVAASTMQWGEPSIETAISTVRHARLLYRGQDAVTLAQTATCEDAARLLWDSARPISFAGMTPRACDPFSALAALIPVSYPALGRGVEKLHEDAEQAIACLATALGAATSQAPLHERLAKGWGLDEPHSAPIRMALVLIADHELNASTFGVRVAASTGASMAACLLAGLSTLSGPRHGGAANAAMALLHEAHAMGARATLTRHLATGQALPGFGHPLYPMGDPRAAALLKALPPNMLTDRLSQDATDLTGTPPNIDFALAALAASGNFPQDAPFRLFALGRSLGWVAHAVEQLATGSLIRPRGIYTGKLPPN
ncbi:excisionase [Acidisoma cellulosilytica]|uniref:citrate synthase (unknown stereospecificity) n=1 Tax=Acidisoma cellulosilyticum TaxID=2802395 RepID=A0A964E1T9_9PROT|nr:citrate synthase [Acidisoma cellulosilyticum]MCB8878701.1 excisionase [Acidisoma cellulosilyticum]